MHWDLSGIITVLALIFYAGSNYQLIRQHDSRLNKLESEETGLPALRLDLAKLKGEHRVFHRDEAAV